MSKTTKKYGKPAYTMCLRVDANPTPSPKLKREWALLDKYSKEDYNKPYEALSDFDKIQVHFNLNTGVYRERDKKAREVKATQK